MAVPGPSLAVQSGAVLCRGAQASRSSGFSCCASWTLGLGFSSCGTGP